MVDIMRNKIVEYVKNQINVNLENYRTDFTKQFERKDEIIIEWREMNANDFRNFELLASSKNSKIRTESVGVWGVMVAMI